MKKQWRMLVSTIAVLCTSVMMSGVAYAENVTHVNLSFTGEQPVEGNSLAAVNVSSGGGETYGIRVSGYQNNETTWQRGDTPRVFVELYTNGEDTRFNCSGSSHFSLHGMGASYRSAQILDDGHRMELIVTLSRVKGDGNLEIVDSLWWDGRTARWDATDDADRYEVQLYRNDHKITTEKTGRTHYSFSDNMSETGSYYFRVRGVDNDNRGGWSDWSDDYEVNRNRDNYYSNNHSSSCPEYTYNSTTPGWRQENGQWRYYNQDGGYPYNAWLQLSNKWYFFNSNGYMVTGWVNWKGIYYYLGADGAMYVNSRTPDGYQVGGDGAWIQNAGQTSGTGTSGTQNQPKRIIEGIHGGPGVS